MPRESAAPSITRTRRFLRPLRERSRASIALVAAVAFTTLACGDVGDSVGSPNAAPAVSPPSTSAPTDTSTSVPITAPTSDDSLSGTTVPSDGAEADRAGEGAPGTTDPTRDPVAEFLDQTTEVYRRSLDGSDVVVWRSDLSWADFFQLEWRAPTGSAELCMGDYALLVGVVAAEEQSMRPAWSAIEVFDDPASEVAVDLDEYNRAIVRTSGLADEVTIVADGIELDRTGFVDGLAVLDAAEIWDTAGSAEEAVLITHTDGVPGDPIPFAPGWGRTTEEYYRECMPGPYPMLPLPPAGEQPPDPLAAEAEVLDAYARALDRSVLLPDEDPPSVDDITGIVAAVADVDAGGMADVAAMAEHTVDELVFTAPDEAWFLYTITSDLGVLTGRYGRARFNGQVWQITRDTICQDLALAGGRCVPESVQNEPPPPDGWSEVIAEYDRTSSLYWTRNCLPQPFGPGLCDE